MTRSARAMSATAGAVASRWRSKASASLGGHRTTRLTSLPPPATTIRSGARPSRIARIFSRARTAASMSAVVASAATTTLSRSLPLTWTGISRVDSTTAVGSTTGHVWVWIETHGAPAAARRRLHSSSVICGAAGREHQQEQADGLIPFGRVGYGRAPVTEQRVGQLHQLGDHRVEVEGRVVGRDVAQRPMGGRAQGGPGVGLRLAGRQRPRLGIARLASVRVEDERPDPVQEAVDAADAGRAPRAALVPRAP